MRIILLGYVVRGPLGGLVWHHLQYFDGLRRLGHDVYFFEDSDDYEACYDPQRDSVSKDASYGLRFAQRTFASCGLEDRWAYYDAHTNMWFGSRASSSRELLRTADLILNLSGMNPIREWTLHAPHLAFIDTDPVFTQVRHLTDPVRRKAASAHTAFFTFAENFAKSGCEVPDDGFPWLPTRQPVVLERWPVSSGPSDGNFTTVMQWDSYPPVEHLGRFYGMKSSSFEPYWNLPACVDAQMEMALGSASAPRDSLRASGWIIRNPLEVTRDAWSYQQYIRDSKAEFTVAKHAYVVSRSGWFSERSAVYLASGRPVVTQDTGFTDVLKTGWGLLAFDSLEAAADSIRRIDQDYPLHCRCARTVAEDYFASAPILRSLVERATSPANPKTTAPIGGTKVERGR